MEKKWFASLDAAFKVAVAYAIANNLIGTPDSSFSTIWNVGTLARGGDFKATVDAVVGEEVSWDRIQRLGDAGLRALAARAEIAEYPLEALLPEI